MNRAYATQVATRPAMLPETVLKKGHLVAQYTTRIA